MAVSKFYLTRAEHKRLVEEARKNFFLKGEHARLLAQSGHWIYAEVVSASGGYAWPGLTAGDYHECASATFTGVNALAFPRFVGLGDIEDIIVPSKANADGDSELWLFCFGKEIEVRATVGGVNIDASRSAATYDWFGAGLSNSGWLSGPQRVSYQARCTGNPETNPGSLMFVQVLELRLGVADLPTGV